MALHLPNELVQMIVAEPIEPFNITITASPGDPNKTIIEPFAQLTNLRLINQAANDQFLRSMKNNYTGVMTVESSVVEEWFRCKADLAPWQEELLECTIELVLHDDKNSPGHHFGLMDDDSFTSLLVLCDSLLTKVRKVRLIMSIPAEGRCDRPWLELLLEDDPRAGWYMSNWFKKSRFIKRNVDRVYRVEYLHRRPEDQALINRVTELSLSLSRTRDDDFDITDFSVE